MALLNIRTNGDPVLRKKSRPVEVINDRIITLLDDMHETLKLAQGLGLAAPQVGVLRRVVIIELDGKLYEMINPEIVETKGYQEEIEACLSVPDLYGLVRRPAWVKIKALDRYGKEYFAEGTGLLARAFSHETDHLDGVLYIDKAKKTYTPDEVEEV